MGDESLCSCLHAHMFAFVEFSSALLNEVMNWQEVDELEGFTSTLVNMQWSTWRVAMFLLDFTQESHHATRMGPSP